MSNHSVRFRISSSGSAASSDASNENAEPGIAKSGSDVSSQNLESGISNSRRPVSIPRLVPRNLPFDQSKNQISVGHYNKRVTLFRLLRHDYFHVLLRLPTYVSLFWLLSLWTIMIVVFAAIYRGVDGAATDIDCGLATEENPLTFGGYFAFSLETCTTVGYGLPGATNAFFNNCPRLQVVIYFQMVWSMMFNAFLFAFFYSRLSKCDARGAQVVFSSKAVVSFANKQVRLQMRLYDTDAKLPVVEAHVRLYAVMKDRPVPRPLRVLQPNDDFGSMLFLSWPTVVSHHVDLYSLLHPTKGSGFKTSSRIPLPESGLHLRQVDSITASREEVVCPICSESYRTLEAWARHVAFQKIVEEKDEYPVDGTHLCLTEEDFKHVKNRTEPMTDIQALRQYFQESVSEIICVVEGIDPLLSGTFQALQSYRAEDIVWDDGARFAPCLEIDSKNDTIRVDLNRFHETEIIKLSKSDLPKDNSKLLYSVFQNNSSPKEGSQADIGQRSLRPHDSFIAERFFRQPSQNSILEEGVEESFDDKEKES